MAAASAPSPEAEVRALYEQTESDTARAFEELVSKPSFGVLLARMAENAAAIARIGSDSADLVLRNLRLAGRADVTRLARQLHRTEDKLERVLQELEQLRDERAPAPRRRTGLPRTAAEAGPEGAVSALETLARLPRATFDFANVILTTPDAAIGETPREVVWTHRGTTLYRYRSSDREQAIPILLVFALINRPEIFDLRKGSSFVEFLLAEGFDVFLVDWGVPDDEDSEMGLAEYVCDELHWAVRETLRASGEDEVTLLGWCIGGTLCAMYCALHPVGAVRNAVLLTTPIDPSGSLYARWVGSDEFDVDFIADRYAAIPGAGIDMANKLMKPVTNYATTYRRLFRSILDGEYSRVSYQAMAKWVSDNPPFPSRAYREWITWMYKENRLVDGRRAPARRTRRPDADRAEPARGDRRGRPHRPTRGHRPVARPGRERGRHAHGPPGRPHRADGRLEGQASGLARARALAARALGSLDEENSMSVHCKPDGVDRQAPASARASRVRHRRHPGDRGGDLPQPGRAGRGRRGRLQPRPRGGPGLRRPAHPRRA